MGTPPLSRELAAQAVQAMNQAVRIGKSYKFAGELIGLPESTIYKRIQAAKFRYGIEVDALPPDVAPVPELSATPTVRQTVRVKAWRVANDDPVYKVVAVGDAHDSPALPDKSRFKWIARYAADVKPDQLVQIGDFGSFDSLSRHDAPGSLSQKLRPSFARDMESLEEALAAIHGVIGTDIPLHVTLGNHEARVQRFESNTAEIEGALWQPLLDLFARYGWRTHDEGLFHFVGGVGFVHAPRTLMGREYGGKTLNAVANDAMFSIVFGHSHRMQVLSVPKIGPLAGVDIINLGTCMPTNHVEHYARVSTTGWTYGVMLLTIQGGRVIGHEFTSIDDLSRRYG